jgi:pSer/pThr/pTyr-binding forkhead associated (FHA) protein
MTSRSSVFFKHPGPIPFDEFAECFVGVEWHELASRLGGPYLLFKNEKGGLMVVELRTYKSVIIGRSIACQIMIEDSSISRTHAQIERIKGQWFIQDMISSYGTHVSDTELFNVHELKSEEVIRVGKRVEILFLEKTDVIPALFNEFSKRLNDIATGESEKPEDENQHWSTSSVA